MRRLASLLIILALVATSAPVVRAQDEVDQAARLAALCRVWGLAKYFHPDVTGGAVDWDAALISAIPRVNSVTTKAALNEELLRVMRAAGPEPRLPAGVNSGQLETDPFFAWIDDGSVFEYSSMQALKAIRHATVPLTSKYVRRGNAGQPDFLGEAVWAGSTLPDQQQRLLALFRYWNMVQYYFPSREIMDRPWPEVLVDAIPRFMAATTDIAYHQTVAELIANINDSHGSFSSQTMSVYWGLNLPPIRTRYIESQTVVTRVFDRYLDGADVRVGDVITDMAGVAAAAERARVARYLASSNQGALQRSVDIFLLRTNAASMTLGLSRNGVNRRATVRTYPGALIAGEDTAVTNQEPKWRMLPGNIGYVNMGLLQVVDVPVMIDALKETRAIVFDVRNYPNGTLYQIAQWLNPASRDFVSFTEPDYRRPGRFTAAVTLRAGPSSPRSDAYRGRVLVLGDERTQSHAEFTMMALRTAPDVVVLGSPTAGADGNVTQIDLPGGIRTFFSGLGVFYPDGTPTQRVGIVPDVHVTPTVEGIRNGIDEVLQRALTFVP